MTYKLTIEKINIYPEIQGFIKYVSDVTWRITATDEDNYEGYVEVVFSYKVEDTLSFISFDNLTESDVVGWVEDRLGNNGLAHYKNLAVKNINKSNPIVSEEVVAPWIN